MFHSDIVNFLCSKRFLEHLWGSGKQIWHTEWHVSNSFILRTYLIKIMWESYLSVYLFVYTHIMYICMYIDRQIYIHICVCVCKRRFKKFLVNKRFSLYAWHSMYVFDRVYINNKFVNALKVESLKKIKTLKHK